MLIRETTHPRYVQIWVALRFNQQTQRIITHLGHSQLLEISFIAHLPGSPAHPIQPVLHLIKIASIDSHAPKTKTPSGQCLAARRSEVSLEEAAPEPENVAPSGALMVQVARYDDDSNYPPSQMYSYSNYFDSRASRS